MERSCRALRFALRCCGRHLAALLPPLARSMGALYLAQAHSCLLYLASILVDELAAVPHCGPDLIAMLQALMPRAFLLLQQENGLKDNPDTVDDLFRLCIRSVAPPPDGPARPRRLRRPIDATARLRSLELALR